jgi:ATP-binding protein involved in chromosome partitioning
VVDIFGSGGGNKVAHVLSQALETEVPLLGRVPFDVRLREGGDSGAPLVIAEPKAPAAEVLRGIAERLGKRPRGLSGLSLGLTPASRF